MRVTRTGSVRVDLVGGTLDIDPINLILPNAFTLNVATSLKAKVTLESSDREGVEIVSEDYNKTYSYSQSQLTDPLDTDIYQEMSFVIQLLSSMNLLTNIKLTLSSGAPAGSGLGGSSAMGVTIFKAICDFKKIEMEPEKILSIVKAIESRILNKGTTGYQDYYPALFGGVLALKPSVKGIEREQLYSLELKNFLESNITLIYSGISRNSGINNWDVYKRFFDNDQETKNALSSIAKLSFETYEAIKRNDFAQILDLIGLEGEQRKTLAPTIVPSEVESFFTMAKKIEGVHGMKMCGAGGGGCFIITHEADLKDQLKVLISEQGFKHLDFQISAPMASYES